MIAGTASLLGLIISKEQKTSEFRQAWIDALRNDLTAFLTQINAITDAIKVKYTDHSEKVKILRPLYMPLNTSTFNILLRVNPNENNSKRLLKAMESFNSLTADESKLTAINVRKIEKEFLVSSQLLLKSEWKRVKSGELTFKIAKLLALIVIVGSIVIGGVAAYRMWESDKIEHSQALATPPLTQNGLDKGSTNESIEQNKITGGK